MWPSLLDSSGEPPKKKLRVADDFSGKFRPVLLSQLHEYLHGVVGSEIRKLAAADLDIRKACDRRRPEIIGKFATAELASALHRHGGRLPPALEAELAHQVAVLLSKFSTPPVPLPTLSSQPPPLGRLANDTAAPLPKSSNSPIPLPSFGSQLPPRPPPTTAPHAGRTSHAPHSDGQSVDGGRTANGTRSHERSKPRHIPTTPLREKSQLNATSPQNFRTRAHALAWREDAEASASERDRPNWASLASRPYKPASWRQQIISGTRKLVRLQPDDLKKPQVVHVDFSAKEIQELWRLIRLKMCLGKAPAAKSPRRQLMDLLKDHHGQVSQAVSRLPQQPLHGRTVEDIKSFLDDLRTELASDATRKRTKHTKEPLILSLERDDYDRQGALARSSRVDSLLFAREVAGQRGYGSMRRLENFTNEFRKCREDDLELRAEWAGCAGDVTTITWVSDDGFICGTTEHSDPHNQQYNKPGNLVLGSCSRGTLRAYPDHRIVRPVIEKGENSSAAMVESQSPWLYTSVVASDYDVRNDMAYTCGFDRTVKIWKADKSGSSMANLGTWHHDGNVNFVVASQYESGMVATAADVATEAVRIYHVDPDDIPGSPFRSYSCSRVVDLEGRTVSTEKWAYFPASIQWGRCKAVQHLVAVGYSPRSRTQDDNDIPEDRRNTGELCVWDGLSGERWTIVAGSKLNVFEILWHPTQPCFIAATSPQGQQGVELDARIRTQIRVYARPKDPEFHGGKAFFVHQTLDCHAVDINELTIMPNSLIESYVTAGCTDGKTYVWDTALGDKPIHVLKHGKPIEEFNGDREREDTGVKFCAWGSTPDCFYTGSSDGVVKVWNVRTKGKPRARDLLEVPGPVSFGQFSPDRSKLVIGDATGRVWFLSVDENEQQPGQVVNLVPLGVLQPDGKKRTRRPQLMIPHPDPDPPAGHVEESDEDSGAARARTYLEKKQIVLTGHPTIGAVQGPNYAETGHYRKELHADDDPAQPLLASQAILQQDARPRAQFVRRSQELRPLRSIQGLAERHSANLRKDLDLTQLSEETKEELRMARAWVPGARVESDCDYDFDYGGDLAWSEDGGEE